MAKKISLDFSKVEERSGWNTKEMPEGLHEFKIELVDHKDANDGTTMWTYGLRPTNPKYKTRLFPYYCKHQANQLFKLRDLFIAAGLTVPKKKVSLDPDAPIGKIIAAEVTDSRNPQYLGRSEIDGVYDRSIIDDEDQLSDDEEEVDEEELEDDYDEEEEEGDDDRAEELEGMTLAQLRKEAKGLGVDTEGLKKAELVEAILEEEGLGEEEEDDEDEDDFDDEDLGDEDLDDEEFDDEEFEDDEEDEEEEEPAPAPKRRSASSAKKAPARRVVKRR